MSELRPGAHVVGSDGLASGSIDAFIVDPVALRVTHVVIAVDHFGTRVVLPLTAVTEAHPDEVRMGLTAEELLGAQAFDEPDYKTPDEGWHPGDLAVDPGSYYLEPFASPLTGWSLTSHERVPRGEVLFRRGAEVRTTDGHDVGRVDEFLIDPADGHITHVVLREGHLRPRDVVVPITAAAELTDDRVVLELTLAEVDGLPHIPVKRHGHLQAD